MESFLVGFLAGTYFSQLINFTGSIPVILASLMGLFFILAVFLKGKYTRIFCLFIIGAILAVFYFQLFVQKPSPKYISYYNSQKLTLEGKVVDAPERGDNKTKLIIQVANITGKILVNAPTFPEYKYGDKLKIKGKLETPPIFDDFNYNDYLKGKGIYSIINYPEIELVKAADSFSIKRMLFSIKNRLIQTLNRTLPEPESSLSVGIVLGQRSGMPDWLYQAFIVVGLIHLVALSGYNVTIISKYISYVLNLAIPPLAFYASILCIWLFVLMVGASATIVRAALMGSMFLFGRRVGRGRSMTRILLLTAFFMTLFNPFILRYDRGFQLSFLATCGLVYLAPILEGLIRKWKINPTLKEAGVSTLSAQIFVLPLLMFSFKRVSLVALPVNLIVLPLIPTTMLLIFLTALGGLIFFPLGQFFGLISFLFLKYIDCVAQYFSKIPGASLTIKKSNLAWLVLYWLFLAVVLRWIKTSRRRSR